MSGLLADGKRRLAVSSRRLTLRLRRDPRPLDVDAALRQLRGGGRVLFLCHGNICRSPLAERYLRSRLRERGLAGFDVESAGFFETEDRPSPRIAAAVSPAYGVDLSDHRSRRVTSEMLAATDVTFLMDARNYHSLRGRFGGGGTEAYFLKPFASGAGGSFEIADPYGGDEVAFHRAFSEIAGAVDGLVEAL